MFQIYKNIKMPPTRTQISNQQIHVNRQREKFDNVDAEIKRSKDY